MEKRGRKKIDNSTAVSEAIATPEKREVFIDQLNKLARTKSDLISRSKLYGEDVKGVADAYNMSKGFVGGLVVKIVNADIDADIDQLTNTIDVLEMLKDGGDD